MRNDAQTGDESPLIDALLRLVDAVPADGKSLRRLSARRSSALRSRIESAIERLNEILVVLDPVKTPTYVLDPSDPQVVGKLIADTLLVQERCQLARVASDDGTFYGSGVYALYYTGEFDSYLPASGTDTPLYIGRADPASHDASSPKQQGQRLWRRLKDHRRSIESAQNLRIEDFYCRFLVVKSAWQATAESYLIDRFTPVWNNETKICFGFGKHGDDPATRANARSPWDTLHPGRKWALKEENTPGSRSIEDIKKDIAAHYHQNPPK